jgi:serine/threonine-protein kinase 24/25/MST4
MASNSRLLRKPSRADSSSNLQPKALTKSPSSSPVKEEYERTSRPKALEPNPVPSSNPASQYTLLEKLGTGSFGTVYKAIHNDTKQVVAIKQIGACINFWMVCRSS